MSKVKKTTRDLISNLPTYRKAVAAFLTGLAGFAAIVVAAVSDGHVTPAEWVQMGAAFATWFGGTGAVYQTRNEEQ